MHPEAAERRTRPLLSQAADDPDVVAVLLYGGTARGDATPSSDVDVALVLNQPRPTAARPDAAWATHKRIEYLHHDAHVAIFQQLPLYVRSRVLREGRVLLVKNEDFLYALAIKTAQAFEDFKPHYRLYLEQTADA